MLHQSCCQPHMEGGGSLLGEVGAEHLLRRDSLGEIGHNTACMQQHTRQQQRSRYGTAQDSTRLCSTAANPQAQGSLVQGRRAVSHWAQGTRQRFKQRHSDDSVTIPDAGHIIGLTIGWCQAKFLNHDRLVQLSSESSSGLDEVVIDPGEVVGVARGAEVDAHGFRVHVQSAKADVWKSCVDGVAHTLVTVARCRANQLWRGHINWSGTDLLHDSGSRPDTQCPHLHFHMHAHTHTDRESCW